MRRADTPAKLTQLENLPQHKILSQEKDGQPVYLYDTRTPKTASACTLAPRQTTTASGLSWPSNAQGVEAAQRAIDAQWLDTEAFGNQFRSRGCSVAWVGSVLDLDRRHHRRTVARLLTRSMASSDALALEGRGPKLRSPGCRGASISMQDTRQHEDQHDQRGHVIANR